MLVWTCKCKYIWIINLVSAKLIGPIFHGAEGCVFIGNCRQEITMDQFRDQYADCYGQLLGLIMALLNWRVKGLCFNRQSLSSVLWNRFHGCSMSVTDTPLICKLWPLTLSGWEACLCWCVSSYCVVCCWCVSSYCVCVCHPVPL